MRRTSLAFGSIDDSLPIESRSRNRPWCKTTFPATSFLQKIERLGWLCFSASQLLSTWCAATRISCIKLLGSDIAQGYLTPIFASTLCSHLVFLTRLRYPLVTMSPSMDKSEIQYIDEKAESIESPKPYQIIKIDNFQVLGLAPEDADFYINYSDEQRKRVIHKVSNDYCCIRVDPC